MRLLASTRLMLGLTWIACAALIVGGLFLLSAPSYGEETNHAEPDAPQADGDTASEAAEGEEHDPAEADDPWSFSDFLADLQLTTLWTDNAWLNWIVLFIAILAGLIAGKIASAFFQRVGQRIEHLEYPLQARMFTDAASPANLALITIGIQIGVKQLKLPEGLEGFSVAVVTLLIYIAIFWYVFNLVSIIDVLMRRLTAKTKSKLDDMIVPLVRKTLRIFIVIVGFLLVAENVFGQNIGAWLTGLGIAGLAVSLAAQDSLKNIFGSVTIFLDQPFRVGDRISYGGFDGPVEQIGFRSTKIRTLTGHLVTVPNSNIVNDPVENIGRRPYIRRTLNVTITYDTPREKIEQAVQILRDILEEPGIAEPIHGKVGENEFPPRVFFSDYNAASLNILVIYWFFPPMYWDFMEHAQRLNLRLFEEFERAGIDFAFPTQTLYLAGDANRPLFNPEPRGAASG